MIATPLVTIIIPVYNVERYLHDCLDSVVNQTYHNLEIICVNDGSTDSSGRILSEYASNDNRICVIDQKNAGVAKARNTAIDKSSGKYVIFWDSDDYFDLEAIELMVNKAESADADVCLCDVQRFDNETGEMWPANYIPRPLPEEEVFSWKTWSDTIFLNSAVSCNKLIRRDFMIANNIRYPEFHIYEDLEIMVLLMRLADKIVLVNKKLAYYRRNREGSLTYNPVQEMNTLILSHKHAWDVLMERDLLNNQRLINSFVHKTAIDYRGFFRSLTCIEHFRLFFKKLTEEDTILTKYDPVTGVIPVVEYLKVGSVEDFMVEENSRFYDMYIKHRQTSIDRYAEIKRLRAENRKLEKKQWVLDEKLKNAYADVKDGKKAIRELNEKLAIQNKRNAKLQEKYDKLISSFSYKLARILTWIPRKLKKLIK